MSQAEHEPRGVAGGIPTEAYQPKPPPTPEETTQWEMIKAHYRESVKFYSRIGFPQYAGRYEPFAVAKGYEVREIKETPSGLEVTYIPSFYKEEPKGIAETLASYTTKPLISYFGITPPPQTPIEFVRPRETVRPFAGVAGLIAPAEALTYSVGRLAGLETPRIPPTIVSFAPQKAMEYGPEYAAGTISGDILLSIGFGKVAGKIWQYTPKIIKAPVTKVAEAVAKPFRPLTEPIMSKLEKWALWPHERIASGIVSVPTGKIIPSHEVYGEIWEWGLTPKTSLLFTEKGFDVSARELPKWFIRGTAMVPMATRQMEVAYKPMPYGYAEPWKRVPSPISGGLPMPQVTELAKPSMEMGLPYVPKVVGLTSKGLTQALGMGLALLPKALPKETVKPKLETLPKLEPAIKRRQPTFEEPYEIQKLRLFPRLYPKQREKAIPSLMPKLSLRSLSRVSLKLEVLQIPRQEQKLAPTTTLKLEVSQMTKQLQTLAPAIPTPTLTIPKFPTAPFTFRRSHGGEDWTRRGRGLFGKWFKRTHAIPTEKQIMRSLGFGTEKRRGVKRRRH